MAGATIYALVGNPFDPFDNRRFSPDEWRTARSAFGRDPRPRMARDVIRRVIRPGMPEKRVLELLGPPQHVSDRRGPGGDPLPGRRIYQYPYWQLDISAHG